MGQITKGNKFSGTISRIRHLGVKKHFFSVLEHKIRLIYVFFFFPLSICSLIERNIPLRNILLMYVNLDMEQKTLQPFPSPQ